jgi:hypothetical protein
MAIITREIAEAGGGVADADFVEREDDFLLDVADLGAVKLDGFADLITDGEDRVERGSRFLKNVGDLFPAEIPQIAIGQLQRVAALELDPS